MLCNLGLIAELLAVETSGAETCVRLVAFHNIVDALIVGLTRRAQRRIRPSEEGR